MGRAGGSRGARSGRCGRSFAFPAPAPPPSARTFPGAREVMINSGLALSPPRVPPGPTPCSAAPFRPGRLGRARRTPLTVNSDSRPPWARLPQPLPFASRPRDPPLLAREPGPLLPPSAPQPLDEAFAENLFAPCTTSCGEEKYHCDEMSLKNRLHFPGGCWERH